MCLVEDCSNNLKIKDFFQIIKLNNLDNIILLSLFYGKDNAENLQSFSKNLVFSKIQKQINDKNFYRENIMFLCSLFGYKKPISLYSYLICCSPLAKNDFKSWSNPNSDCRMLLFLKNPKLRLSCICYYFTLLTSLKNMAK